MKIRRFLFAYWIPKAKNTIRICNTDFFSTVIIVARTRLQVTFVCTLPALLVSLNFLFANIISLVVTKNITQDYDTDRQVLLVVMWNRSLHKSVSQLSTVIMNNSTSTVDNSLVVDTSPLTDTSYPLWRSGSRIVKVWPLFPYTIWSPQLQKAWKCWGIKSCRAIKLQGIMKLLDKVVNRASSA